jgi:serine phosphatase RsbU (regulator of sigma subunit)
MVASFQIEVPQQQPVEVLLDAHLISVGRAENNTLPLRDMNVSRHHFSVELVPAQGYVLQDQGSRNGTVVNGQQVKKKILEEGDRIHVGGSTLTFRAEASPQAMPLVAIRGSVASTPVTPLSGYGLIPQPQAVPSLGNRVTRSHRPKPAFTNLATSPEPPTRPSGRMPRIKLEEGSVDDFRWRKLAEVACAINLERDVDALLEKILDAVLALVPAKSAFLVLCEEDTLNVKASRGGGAAVVPVGQPLESYRMSRQVCKDAIEKRSPVLTQDAVSDDNLGSFLTVMNLQLKSILCVPFSSKDAVLGVVYLDEPACDPFQEKTGIVELVGAFGDLAGIALDNARLLAEVAARERLEEELRIAAVMQRSLLPKVAPEVKGLEVAGENQAARTVGGDIYDYFTRTSPVSDTLISIGDVAGKGVGAGMVMAAVRSLLHAYAEVYVETDELLTHLNSVLSQDLDPGIFVSFLLIRYNEETGVLRYTGAGHEHLILFRPSTGQTEFLRAGGVVLGLVDDLSGRIEEKELFLKPGDVVCLYTDGATEAQDASKEEFGLDRLAEAVRAGDLAPQAIVDRCMQAVREFTGVGRELHDDLTIVALRKT